jgi:hypothetical protein
MKNKSNKQKKLITAVASAFIITASITPLLSDKAEAAANFKDVPAGAFYEKAVQTLSEKGVVGGYEDGTFKPGKSVTRAEAAKMLAFDLGLTTSGQSSNFTDVTNNHWFYQPVTALSQAGGISGYENKTFQPNKTITRAEMASMLVKAYSLQTNIGAENSPFNDVTSNSWYASAVQTLYKNKITSGKSANKFAPNDPVTRGEIAAFIHKVNEAKGNEEKVDKGADASSIIEKISEDSSAITISGTTYKIPTSLNGILNSSNSAILANAKMSFEEKDGAITKITYLQLNTNGQPSETTEFSNNLVLDGKGNTINGTVEVNANFITLKNMTINGNLEITSKLTNDFYSEKLTVQGKTLVNGGDDNTVVFKDAKLGTVDINKKDVKVEAKGTTSVQHLNINSNANVVIDENTKINKTILNGGATEVKLEGVIALLESLASKQTALKGNAAIKELQVKNSALLSLEIKNKIATVVAEKGVKFSLGANTAIGHLQIPFGTQASEFVTNFNDRKNNIEKTNNDANSDYKDPNTSAAGGGGGGGISGGGAPTTNKPDVQDIIDYKPNLTGLQGDALTEYNTLKAKAEADMEKNNGKISLGIVLEAVQFLDAHDPNFSPKSILDKLTQSGLSKEEALNNMLQNKDYFNSLLP